MATTPTSAIQRKMKVRLPLITAGCSAIIKKVVITARNQLPGFELFIFLAVVCSIMS
jgi:hypothetical protein